jgi:hypothetical protein
MQSEVEAHIAAVEALYRPLLTGGTPRLHGGAKLWAQFKQAANSCDVEKPRTVAALIERVNELVVARLILNDPALKGELRYEPGILPDDRRIDFVIHDAAENTYIEVKTVNPRADDSDENWQKYLDRREHHPESVHYIVDKGWLGAALYGNSVSARAHFLEYACHFEARLAAAKAVRSGPGVLIFCGTGFAWHRSELEDFADFYLTGRHRSDDPFGAMERHAIQTKKIELLRNISAFGFVKRDMAKTAAERFVMPVRGRRWLASARPRVEA